MKRILVALCLVLSVVLMVCLMPTNDVAFAGRQLTAPTNIQLTENGTDYFITWECVENNGFTIKIGELTASVEKNVTQYNVTSVMEKGVKYSVSVKALGQDDILDSDYSVAKDIVITTNLDKPTNLAVSDEKVLSWDSVTSATGYTVVINGVKVAEKVSSTSLDISTRLSGVGEYVIKVKAVGDNTLTLDSFYTKYTYTNKTKLDVPQNVSANVLEHKITWDAVDNAVKYGVVVDDGEVQEVSGTEFSMAGCTTVKDYSVKVKALANGNYTESDYSEVTTYTVSQKIKTPAITFDDDTKVASWVAPTGADKYTVKITKNDVVVLNNAEYSGTSIDITSYIDDLGYYLIEVGANGNGNYQQSDIGSYTYNKYEKLSTPSLTMTGTTVSWAVVSHAVNYTIYVNDVCRSTTYEELEYDFLDDIGAYGDYIIKVIANGNGWYTASDEATVTYTYSETPATTKYFFNVTLPSSYVVFVDDVKTAYTFDDNRCIELPSTAKKVIIARDSTAFDGTDAKSIKNTLFAECTLNTDTFNSTLNAYTVTINVDTFTSLSDGITEGTEGLYYVVSESYGKCYYYVAT